MLEGRVDAGEGPRGAGGTAFLRLLRRKVARWPHASWREHLSDWTTPGDQKRIILATVQSASGKDFLGQLSGGPQRGSAVLGPQERDRALARIFPKDISRFFLFDGELLQEYEELIISESVVGPQISSAIERILGVPILKAARRHLTELAERPISKLRPKLPDTKRRRAGEYR